MPYFNSKLSYLLVRPALIVAVFVVAVTSILAVFAAPTSVSAATKGCVVINSNTSATYYQDCASKDNPVRLSRSGPTGPFTGGVAGTPISYQYNDGELTVITTDYVNGGSIRNTEAIDIFNPATSSEAIAAERREIGNTLSSSFNNPIVKSSFKEKFCADRAAASGAPCSDSVVDEAWSSMLVQCDTSAIRVAESQLRTGGESQAANAYKENIAQCIANNSNTSRDNVLDALPDNIYQQRNTAAANARASVTGESNEADQMSCNISGIGWIVCPVMIFVANITDTAFNFLSSTFLETQTAILNHDSVRAAWGAMRNIANVAFVLAFLVIIYSQLTGAGINNYGVKKLLPRLIIAAILVNLSFVLCQIAIDISNLLGYSMNSFFVNGLGGGIQSDISDQGESTLSQIGAAVTATVLMTGILAGGVALALAVASPVLVAAFFALLMIVLILVGRTALIIMLTIISPLAFVAFLLPNTEQYFKKWYKLFFSLLLLFPIISVVFGASGLAAMVINDAAASSGQEMMQIVALGVATIPLFVVPGLLKGALNATGSIGTKLSGLSGKANARVSKQAMSKSRLGEATRAFQRRSAARRIQRRSGDGIIARGGRALTDKFGEDSKLGKIGKAATSAGTVGAQIDKTAFGRYIGGGQGAAMAAAAADKEDETAVAEQVTLFRSKYGSTGIDQAAEEMKSAIEKGDGVSARAMQRYLMSAGTPGITTLEDIYRNNNDTIWRNSSLKQNLSSDALANGIKGKSAAIDRFSTSKYNEDGSAERSFDDISNDKSLYTSLNAVELSTQKNLSKLINDGIIDKTMANNMLSNPTAAASLSVENKRKLEILSGGTGPDIKFTVPKSTIDTATGNVTTVNQLADGKEVIHRIHQISGRDSKEAVTDDSVREGIERLTDKQLGELISYSSSPAATKDAEYKRAINAAITEASRRNKKP